MGSTNEAVAEQPMSSWAPLILSDDTPDCILYAPASHGLVLEWMSRCDVAVGVCLMVDGACVDGWEVETYHRVAYPMPLDSELTTLVWTQTDDEGTVLAEG